MKHPLLEGTLVNGLTIAIILGSTRPGRNGKAVADRGLAKAAGCSGVFGQSPSETTIGSDRCLVMGADERRGDEFGFGAESPQDPTCPNVLVLPPLRS